MRNLRRAAAGLLLLSATPITASSYETEAPIAYLLDLKSGAVLFERNSDKQIPPASMAKMMTVYVAFDQIKEGKLALEKKIPVQSETWRKWNNQGSTMFLRVNDQPTVADLLHGIVTLSGNDASVVLAEGISGTEKAFVELMNRTAERIGMKNSRFGNSNGWPDEGRTKVTARDLAILARATVQDFPELYDQFYGESEFTWNGITQSNRNPIKGKVDGADGLKTGHTEEAGFGFAGSAEQNGRRLVSVLAGLDSYAGRISESVKFMNWGFNAWENRPLFKKGTKIQNAEVQLGDSSTVSLIAPRDLFATLPQGEAPELQMTVNYDGPVKAPIAAGQEIATLNIASASGITLAVPLVAGETIGEAGFFDRVWAGLKALLGLT